MVTAQSLQTLQRAFSDIRGGASKLVVVAKYGLTSSMLHAHADIIKGAAIAANVPDADTLQPTAFDLMNLLGVLKHCDQQTFDTFTQHLTTPQTV
jgi:hypothetical protein